MRLETPADFGAVIRDRRLKVGLSQQALAGKAGVSRQWIVELEKSKPGAPLGMVLRTMNALGILLTSEARKGATTKAPNPLRDMDIDQVLDNLRKKKTTAREYSR
jgi:HTH-type transcriptional regulator/antitoxin HipB